MNINVANVVSIVSDYGEYVRLDSVQSVFVEDNRVRVRVPGSVILLTEELTAQEAIDGRDLILDALYKYAPVVTLATRNDYSGINIIYSGIHYQVNAATSDENWAITKYSYTAGQITLTQGPLVGAWDDRATLGW